MAYITPRRNPLRRLPVRAYAGPFRSPLPGLAGLRRGLGDDGTGPIDIGTSASVTVTPTTTTITPTGGGPVTVATPGQISSPSDWLNANSSTLLWIAGITAGVLLLSRMGR